MALFTKQLLLNKKFFKRQQGTGKNVHSHFLDAQLSTQTFRWVFGILRNGRSFGKSFSKR